MDFIVSYHLYEKIKKKELKESLKEPLKNQEMKKIAEIKEEEISPPDNLIFKTCERCGQEPYFCQCSNNIKLMYHNFNPEKDNY